MALINKLIFFLVYFGYNQILPILGENHSAPPNYKVVNISSLLPKPYCQESTSGPAIGSQKLKIVPRHGPCFPNAKTPTSDSEQLMSRDKVRVRSINKKPKNTPLALSNYDYGSYTVKIGLGTPRQDFLMFDTGSPATWVRCKSCTKGCKSTNRLYDFSLSSTHTNKKSGCNGSFRANYHDYSSVEGIWGCDTFTGDDHEIGPIQNFRFGCGKILKGDFDQMDGMLGLGKGDSSVTSQIPSIQMFSYFIPITSSRMGNLYFGNEQVMDRSKDCSITQFTALVDGQCKDCYYVDLIGISVAGNKLDVSSKMIASGGTVIDSGTVITYLPEEVYYALRDGFRQSMLGYTLLEKADDLMDTCYSVNKLFTIPEIKFHFGKENSIDVSLSEAGTLWTRTESTMCLAFAPAKDSSIIGSVQQRGMNVIYDLEHKRIGFGTNCPIY